MAVSASRKVILDLRRLFVRLVVEEEGEGGRLEEEEIRLYRLDSRGDVSNIIYCNSFLFILFHLYCIAETIYQYSLTTLYVYMVFAQFCNAIELTLGGSFKIRSECQIPLKKGVLPQ